MTSRIAIVPIRDGLGAVVLLAMAVVVGSRGGRDLDPALFGYLGALFVAAFAVACRASAFWRRPASAFYGRTLRDAAREPRRALAVLRHAADDMGGQRFIGRRSRLRWMAHMALSLGTLVSFAITVPLVCGWMHFEASAEDYYQPHVSWIPLPGFHVDGVLAWLTFHALALAAIAVVFGALTLLALRFRARSVPGTLTAAHLGPLLLLLFVALSGLALPATRGLPNAFAIAAALHEVSVILLLIGLASSKLSHVLIRPLQIGARLVRAAGAERSRCETCGEVSVPTAQLAAVEALLAARGGLFHGHQRQCPPCRRRLVASAQAGLVAARFQPPLIAAGRAPRKAA